MNAFLNNNIKDNLCGGCDCAGFTPSVTFSMNASTKVVTITDATTYGSGAARKIVHVIAVDKKNGKKLNTNIPAADGDGVITLDTSSLDHSEGIALLVTVLSDKSCISDGSFHGIGVNALVGAISGWDKDYIAVAP